MAKKKNDRIIFLVDDDSMQLQMLKDYLDDRYEMKLVTFTTGEDALNNMHLQPEVVILDYHLMSKDKLAENGIEILKKMKEIYPLTNVIMLSGQDKISVAVECMKHGAYDYVVKSESAFMRIENLMNNIGEYMKTSALLKIYKTGLYIAVAAILLVIIASILIVKMGGAEAHFVAF